jgi:hypothetical protein
LSAEAARTESKHEVFIRLKGRSVDNPALLHLSASRPQDEMGAFGPLPTVIVTFFLCAQKMPSTRMLSALHSGCYRPRQGSDGVRRRREREGDRA